MSDATQDFLKKVLCPDAETQRRRDAFFKQLDKECQQCRFRHNGANIAMDIPDIQDTRNLQGLL